MDLQFLTSKIVEEIFLLYISQQFHIHWWEIFMRCFPRSIFTFASLTGITFMKVFFCLKRHTSLWSIIGHSHNCPSLLWRTFMKDIREAAGKLISFVCQLKIICAAISLWKKRKTRQLPTGSQCCVKYFSWALSNILLERADVAEADLER